MVLGAVTAFAPAKAAYEPVPADSDYFYSQLGTRARAIYDKLLGEFTGDDRELYYEGTRSIDLMGLTAKGGGQPLITDEDAVAYSKGNKDIFNDFCAAKDALDLDHSELWYIDSGYLSFRVTHGNDGYHVLVGPGRGATYLLGGRTISDVAKKDAALDEAVTAICEEALKSLNSADPDGSYSETDRTAALVTSVHDQVTRKIHYRYEIECHDADNAKYIRTLYGIVTHEGVCEAYARTMQVCLTRLGIECVLVHGLQTDGTPEDHMWNAVNISSRGLDHWYAVDATWDDPLTADWQGKRDLTFNFGLDEKETNTYLLVGQNVVGEHWVPSGFVSTGNFEFSYPTLETSSYSGDTAFGDDNGLRVDYSSGASMEGVPAGVFSATFKGMDAAHARQKGFYFIVKMYDYHPDGTAHVMEDWYYADATFLASKDNPYFGDYGGALRIYTPTCEYVEIAVTSREPDHRSQWTSNAATSWLSSHPEAGFFHGDDSEIVARSGLLYNVNSSYEAPPYVLTQTPAPNSSHTAGSEYRVVVTFDDDLSHPAAAYSSPGGVENDTAIAAAQEVRVRYTTIQQDLHTGGDKVVQIAGELPFDTGRDGIVDMDGGYTDFKWIYKYADDPSACPNAANHGDRGCDVDKGCIITGVEFNFRASDQWIDDVTEYSFAIEGVVGSRSGKFPNNFAFVCTVPGLCPACYRSQGIDWNLWGQPTLLDAPENLDLHELAVAGGTDSDTLKKLDEQIKRDELNGRLMLVVEDKSKGSGNREEYETLNGMVEKKYGYDESDVIGSSVFEINFNRICPMVKLKPNKGESLRVQVGYPAGVTYESLGKGDVELKAYHFTRCDANNKCEHYGEAGHRDGDHILSVEEITIVPTPYGMVIMCDAFSPFEIVAVKKTASKAEADNTLVVVSDGNGSVSVDGHDAVGEYGNVKLASGDKKTFTVKPDAGFAVDTVSLGGEPIAVHGNTFTVSGEALEHSDVLNVTFVPESVHDEDQKLGRTTVVPDACLHASVSKVPGKAEKAATCTEDGYAQALVCDTCGQVVSQAHVVPALGHVPVTDKPEKSATCGEEGHRAVSHCSRCEAELSDGETTPALGHIFTKYVNGAATCRGLEKTAKCQYCDVTSTVLDTAGAPDHKFSSYKVVTPATCATEAIEQATCDYGCGTVDTRAKEGSRLPHSPDATGKCKVCHEFVCTDGHVFVKTPAVAATCTENGHTAGEKCSVCGLWKTHEEVILALGHDFNGHTAGTKCSRCGQKMVSDDHTPVAMKDVAPTCDTQGTKGGTVCSGCGQIIEKPTVIPALGHSWDTSDCRWTWTVEGGEPYACVTLRCKNDPSHVETFAADLTLVKTVEPSTCLTTGTGIYTAAVYVEGAGALSDTNEDVVLPLAEHIPGNDILVTSEATCAHHATETYICSVCGDLVVVTVDGELPPHAYGVEYVAPTCTAAGRSVNVCSVCGHEDTIAEIPATGHSYKNGKCTVCGAAEPKAHDPFPDVSRSKWYAEAVETVSSRGLILGDQNGNFNPDMKTGRGQLMTILARLSGVDTTGSDPWYKAGMDWAVSAGISDGTNPGADLPREQFVTMLYRYMDSPAVTGSLSGYPDAKDVSPWARDAMIWAIDNGLVNGTDAGKLEPGTVANRAVAATILSRFLDKFAL